LLVSIAYKKKRGFGKARTGWEWQCKESENFFSNAVVRTARLRKVTIFVNALDKAGGNVAKDLAGYFYNLNDRLAKGKGTAKICISYQRYPILVANTSLEICVEDENHDDIATYVKHRLNTRIHKWEKATLLVNNC
jgi:hypothetical protein